MDAVERWWDLLGDGVEIDVWVPFRKEEEGCGREKASKSGDVEAICVMHRQDIENHVQAAGPIPYRLLFFFSNPTQMKQVDEKERYVRLVF